MDTVNTSSVEALKYPIGKFRMPDTFGSAEILEWNGIITSFPAILKKEISGLTREELLFRYRPGGWSIQQVVHHFADSHMNAFIRFKLALTEHEPHIKPYHEDRMAELADSLLAPPESSLRIIEGIHQRWSVLIDSLTPQDLEKKYFHPEYNKFVSLNEVLALYAWHSNHHLAHIVQAKKHRDHF
jgi:hypothetical protein